MEPRSGDIVEIDFLDHSESVPGVGASGAALEFKVVGRLVSNRKHTFVIETWCYQNRRTPRDCNVVRYVIVKGAIQRCSILRRGRG